MQGSINQVLIGLSVLEDVLTKWMEWGLGTTSGSCSQLDGEDGMPSTHSEECSWVQVIQYELHVLGFPLVIVCVLNWSGNTESSIRTILYEWRSGVHVALEAVDKFLVGSTNDDWG